MVVGGPAEAAYFCLALSQKESHVIAQLWEEVMRSILGAETQAQKGDVSFKKAQQKGNADTQI